MISHVTVPGRITSPAFTGTTSAVSSSVPSFTVIASALVSVISIALGASVAANVLVIVADLAVTSTSTFSPLRSAAVSSVNI